MNLLPDIDDFNRQLRINRTADRKKAKYNKIKGKKLITVYKTNRKEEGAKYKSEIIISKDSYKSKQLRK